MTWREFFAWPYGADAITQTLHIVNKGTVAVEVGKPRVGNTECGGEGDGTFGYTVQPCKPLKIPPGGSKQITLICITDKARSAPADLTLSLEVSDPTSRVKGGVKGVGGVNARVKSSVSVQLLASERLNTGAYAFGELGGYGGVVQVGPGLKALEPGLKALCVSS